MRGSDEERGCYTPALRLITLSDLQMGLKYKAWREIFGKERVQFYILGLWQYF